MSIGAPHSIKAERGGQRAAMDRMYGVQRHIYDVTRRHYLLGRDRLIADLRPPTDGTVLEVGCGTGWNLVRAAQAYPRARIHGFDISGEMLKSAGKSIAQAGLTDRVLIAQADATDFDPARMFGVRQFDRVFFSYTLSMIPPWREALTRAAAITAPGGSLHVVDFGQCEALPGVFRVLLMSWLRQFHVTPRAELGEALASVAEAHAAKIASFSLYRDYARYACLSMPYREWASYPAVSGK